MTMMIRICSLIALVFLGGCANTSGFKSTKEIFVGFGEPKILFQDPVVSKVAVEYIGAALIPGPYQINATLEDGAIFCQKVNRDTFLNMFLTTDATAGDIAKLRREPDVAAMLGEAQISVPPARGVPAFHLWRLCNGLEGTDFRALQVAVAWGDGPRRRDVLCVIVREGKPVQKQSRAGD